MSCGRRLALPCIDGSESSLAPVGPEGTGSTENATSLLPRADNCWLHPS